MTHTIIPPAIDRGIGEFEGQNGELAARIVGRTQNGVIIRGAKVLATLGPFADELFVYPAGPLPRGTAPEYAACFSIPMATNGLVTLCRDHYGSPDDRRDHPFSSRFDEQDAYMIFDDVEVPYERLFIDADLEMYNGLRTAGWAANVFQQTSIRAAVKLEFAYDMCCRMAKVMNAETRPEVAIMLGELWCYAQLTRAATKAAEAGAHQSGNGAFFCDDTPLRAIRGLMPAWMVRANEIIKLLGSHNLLATPSLAAFDNPEIAPLIERFLPGAKGIQREGTRPSLPRRLGFRRLRARRTCRTLRALLSRRPGQEFHPRAHADLAGRRLRPVRYFSRGSLRLSRVCERNDGQRTTA